MVASLLSVGVVTGEGAVAPAVTHAFCAVQGKAVDVLGLDPPACAAADGEAPDTDVGTGADAGLEAGRLSNLPVCTTQ